MITFFYPNWIGIDRKDGAFANCTAFNKLKIYTIQHWHITNSTIAILLVRIVVRDYCA